MWKPLLFATMAGSVAASAGGWLDARRDRGPALGAFAVEAPIETSILPDKPSMRRHHAVRIDRQKDGLFYVTGYVGTVPVRFLVDTGATTTVLTAADARRIALPRSRHGATVRIATAGGSSSARRVLIGTLSVTPHHPLEQVDAVVTDADLPSSLLGQDSLSRLGPVTINGDSLTLG